VTRPFYVSPCKLMRNIKVIQLIHRIEHITDKLLTKPLEFTYEFISNFRRKDSLTFDSNRNRNKPMTETINTPSI
jgi:hypothetical protein